MASKFEPMVKMMTDEPSVSLKLKKGGKVKSKKHHKEHEEHHGHKPMHKAMGSLVNMPAEMGVAPKRPSMMARMKAMKPAMNPNMYAKGGKVAHKDMGGAMPMTGGGFQMPTAPTPMSPSALAGLTPQQRNNRAMQVRKAITGMKKGGTAHDHKMIEKLEKELHHHEKLDMKHAHPDHMEHKAHGGKVHKVSGHAEGSHEHHKAMCKHYEKLCKEGGSAHHKKMLAHHKKMCGGGSYAKGGSASGEALDHDMTKTTLKNSVKPFVSRADTSRPDHSPAHTGEIHKGNGGGYKHGGTTGNKTPMYKTKEYKKGGRATGTHIPSETNESETRGKTRMGGTIEGNEHYYENTDMHSAKPDHSKGSTGGVRMGNAGGFKHGGHAHKMHHKASGGAIDKYDTRNTVKGGNWENRPADTTPKGKSNTKTGEVKKANGGGYKHGGHASKKHYATGGNVNDMGKAVKMPRRIAHPPVANTMQSGTYAKGGKVEHEEKPRLRLLKTLEGPKGHKAKVYKDMDWQEHRVKFYSPEGKHYTEADYHTDDKEDAHDTAHHQLHRYKMGGKSK